MKYLFCLIPVLFFCCAYNFEYGHSLADFQDKKFQDYLYGESLSKVEKKRLTRNMWVKMAESLAPSNLVIRQYCLIDLYKGKTFHRKRIKNQLNILGKDIWREGYSYWLYVKPLLFEYHKKFNRYGPFIEDMDRKFQETSYLWKDGKLYPAPFGDIRRSPLENEFQSGLPIQSSKDLYPLSIEVIFPDTIVYKIKGSALGFNTHIPLEDQIVVTTTDTIYINKCDNSQVPFEWYKGYDKKYEDKSAEFKDTFNWRRIISLKEMWQSYLITSKKK